jgi:hypothetical protein
MINWLRDKDHVKWNQVNEDPGWEKELALWCGEYSYVSPRKDSRYEKLTYLVHHGTCQENLNPRERRSLRLKSTQYRLINLVFFHINYYGVLLRHLEQKDTDKVLKELHDGPVGGHFVGNTTSHKILRVNYHWPTLFMDAHTYARNCKNFQMGVGR